ncbi:MAG: zf-HC2 domain-containing protein [bacterium]|nr:zf-HC2 domain-containing protein [bacterium]
MGNKQEQYSDVHFISCMNVEEYLDDYLDAEMPLRVRDMFEAHLARCEECRVLVMETRTMLSAVAQLDDRPLDEGVRQRLRETLLETVGYSPYDSSASIRLIK